MAELIDRVGQRFGRLLVLHREGTKNDSPAWSCSCDCGNKTVVSSRSLTTGNTSSCGCLYREKAAAMGKGNVTHGRSSGKDSAEYGIWHGMKTRCYNDKDPHFKNYGARGIKVCARWRDSFEEFYRDMGPRPAPYLTIERKNNDRGYYKANCVWATMSQQAQNRRNTVMNVELAREAKKVRDSGGNLMAWARDHGVDWRLAWAAAVGKTWKETP